MSAFAWARRLWDSISEPRHLKLAYAIVYALVFATGTATLLAPPNSIEGTLGTALTVTWSVLLIVGGIGGLLTVFPGWWWAERLSIALTLAGTGVYGIVVLSLQITQSGSRLTQLGMISIAACVFAIRWLLIRKYSFEPRR